MAFRLSQFYPNIRWLAFETGVYQLLLLAHHCLLFAYCPSALYGVIGSYFSLVYLCVALGNFGYDATLPAYFQEAMNSKKSFHRIIFFHYAPVFLIMPLILVCIFYYPTTLMRDHQSPLLILLLLGILILIESIKKSLRTIMHLSLFNQEVAIIELGSLIFYIAAVWLLMVGGSSVSLPLMLIPLGCSSLLATILYSHQLRIVYETLPSEMEGPRTSNTTIITNRAYNYVTYLSHLLFSGNFLVLLCACHFGFAQAGIFKLATTIIYTAISCLRSILGLSIETILARSKQCTSLEKSEIFSSINNFMNFFITIPFLLCIFTLKVMVAASKNIHQDLWLFLLIFLFFQCTECMMIMYEKFFIVEEKPWYSAINTLIFTIFYLTLLKSCVIHSAKLLLFVLCSARIGNCLFMIMNGSRLWRLEKRVALKPLIFITIITISFSMLL